MLLMMSFLLADSSMQQKCVQDKKQYFAKLNVHYIQLHKLESVVHCLWSHLNTFPCVQYSTTTYTTSTRLDETGGFQSSVGNPPRLHQHLSTYKGEASFPTSETVVLRRS